MQTEPRFVVIPEKKMIGKKLIMSLVENKTVELWRSFMPHRSAIKNRLNSDLISLQIYEDNNYFKSFNPQTVFIKWAAAEVTDFDAVPEGMKPFTLPGGLYAVFYYKGLNTDPQIFNYIFQNWLPNSEYVLDNRPHFEILGEKYKNHDPDSEEEIWIPVKAKV